MNSIKRFGFTLVELVTCIALVCMLAALAVPNYMQAQTSSEVSRAKADLQVLQIGLEAYKVDVGAYPWMNNVGCALRPFFNSPGSQPTLERLTTPISYLPSPAPFYDPFEADRHYYGSTLEDVEIAAGPPATEYLKQYFYHARNLKDTSTWNQSLPHDVDPYWYFLESAGPDRHHHTMWQILNGMMTDTHDNRTTLSKTIYDPTNGAISRGSIWVVGGSPQGTGTSMAAVINAANSSEVAEWRVYE